ncbi:hypothetical protein FQA47_023219 [Oryzias melastigma]|uniref:Uncharacterized protein n=1 Tax=Oryzias melastigma TaxID=30732 RepID=A0A834KVV3_ORYME|nr:hypothetical protein FQA47_023219 [Oryzias melastigma]
MTIKAAISGKYVVMPRSTRGRGPSEPVDASSCTGPSTSWSSADAPRCRSKAGICHGDVDGDGQLLVIDCACSLTMDSLCVSGAKPDGLCSQRRSG